MTGRLISPFKTVSKALSSKYLMSLRSRLCFLCFSNNILMLKTFAHFCICKVSSMKTLIMIFDAIVPLLLLNDSFALGGLCVFPVFGGDTRGVVRKC